MSWDVMIFNFASPPPIGGKLPKDLLPIPLGDSEDVRHKISASLPNIDWTDPTWGQLVTPDYSIEFNYNKHGSVEGFMLHVRGGGDPLQPICKMCIENGWFPYDCSTGAFIDPASPSRDGWQGFQAYRDRAIGPQEESGQQ